MVFWNKTKSAVPEKMQACFSAQQPQAVYASDPVPAFIVYVSTEIDERGKAAYYRDIYQLVA